MTLLVTLAFVAIVVCLGTAMVFMLRRSENRTNQSKNVARALAWRVGLSIVLFVGLLIAWQLGYIHPTGIPPGQ